MQCSCYITVMAIIHSCGCFPKVVTMPAWKLQYLMPERKKILTTNIWLSFLNKWIRCYIVSADFNRGIVEQLELQYVNWRIQCFRIQPIQEQKLVISRESAWLIMTLVFIQLSSISISNAGLEINTIPQSCARIMNVSFFYNQIMTYAVIWATPCVATVVCEWVEEYLPSIHYEMENSVLIILLCSRGSEGVALQCSSLWIWSEIVK